MNRGWLELESDPGLFTLLIEDFGTQGVQVEEIYDLQKAMEGPVYGFIFLFKWIEERRSRRKVIQEDESFVIDENKLNEMFFAQQIIPNSCATHALLSVLLNCDQIKLGDTLTNFKEFCRGMNPEDKGYAIGNMPELARAHNSHARPEPTHLPEKQQGISTTRMMEAFHFVSYVSINGRLFELDGLKPYPIDHGPCKDGEDWTEKFRRVITGRLGMATGGEPYHDIRFNLMAVVPDKRQQYERKLKTLKANRQIVLEALQQMVNVTTPDLDPNKPKPEPAMTRSKAARAAISVTPSMSTNQQQNSSVESSNQGGLKVKLRTRNSGNGTATGVTPIGGSQARFPAALDSHNYCKSPILEESGNKTQAKPGDEADDEQTDSDVEVTESAADSVSNFSESKPTTSSPTNTSKVDLRKFRGVKDKDIKIQIKVGDGKESCTVIPATVALTDVTKPLTIQTKFTCSPIPSFESTDTASETGSNIHSPYSNSPPVFSPTAASARQAETTSKTRASLINRLEGVVKSEKIDGAGFDGLSGSGEDGEMSKEKIAAMEMMQGQQGGGHVKTEKGGLTDEEQKNKFSHQAFTPKDLLALLKNVEGEISCCEANLRDEIEKRKKYKIDDCRRTHTYDQFICTFLSMLAEQGKLADLVEQHMLVKRRQGVTVGRLHKISKVDKRKRARPKRRR